jgi:hypothetical protein
MASGNHRFFLGFVGLVACQPQGGPNFVTTTGNDATGASSSGSTTDTSGGGSGSTAGAGTGSNVGGSTTGNASSTGGTSGSTGGECYSPDSGLCVTSADCHDGYLVCTSDHGGGICVAKPTSVPTDCAIAGSQCGGTSDPICCGLCVDGGCRDLADFPCRSDVGAPCGDTACCELMACVDGGCEPTCGQLNALCNPADGDDDCCAAFGYRCQATVDGGNTYECNNAYSVPMGGGCIPYCAESGKPQCELGSPCDPRKVPDNCALAGLSCDENTDVCTRPYPGYFCIPGGPPCAPNQSFLDSNAGIVCAPNTRSSSQPVCGQLCQSTADCVDPTTFCCIDCGEPHMCIPDALLGRCTPFAACDSQGTNDGICAPFIDSRATISWCFQASADGGGPGSSCVDYASRQNPSFCDTSDWCSGGLCLPVCNAGLSDAGPTCGDSGTQTCIATFDQAGDRIDFGYCLTQCALFTDAGDANLANDCTASGDGAPEVCVPMWWLGATDAPFGGCARQEVSFAQIGQGCARGASGSSSCASGSVCFNETSGINRCDRLCLQSSGVCPDGYNCFAVPLTLDSATDVTGVCLPIDGG